MRPTTILRTLGPLALAAGGSFGALTGCIVLNPNHCAYSGDACEEGLVCSKCAVDNDGCVPAVAVVDDQCFYVEGSSTAGPDTATTVQGSTTVEPPTTGSATVGDSSSTVDPTLPPVTSSETTATSGEPPCDAAVVVDNPLCGGDAPYCLDGACVGCGELPSCAAVEPDKPACEPGSGLCVGCVTSDDCDAVATPVCDTDLATCVKCTEHEQCPETACNLATGECFPPENILYVNNTNNPDLNIDCDDTTGGATQAEPLCRLQKALAKIPVGVPTTIKLAPGSGQVFPASMMPGDRVVAIVPDGKVPSLVVDGMFSALSLSPGNQLFMYRVGIYNNSPLNDPAIACDGARLWLDRQKIYNTRTAIAGDDCMIHVRRSVITGNVDGGVTLSGSVPGAATLWVENSYITSNDGAVSGALTLSGEASAQLLYTTIAANGGPIATIDCINWSGTLDLINSAVVDTSPLISATCMPNVSGTYTSAANDPDPYKVFEGMLDGVFSAQEGGALKGVATWGGNLPRVDYNGDPRPTMEGAMDYAGADVP